MRHGDIERPSRDLMTRLAPLATSTLANALDDCGYPDQAISGIAAVAPGFRCAGPAVTVKEVSGRYGDFTSEDFAVGTMIDAAEPGDLLVVAAGGCPFSTWGGTASYAAKLKGIAGLCVDGSVRDLEEIRAFDFPVFARRLTPTSGRGRLKVEAINLPVELDGVSVMPGDVVVADGSGLLCVPRAALEDVVALAERLAADDAAALKDLDAGLSFSETMAKYKRI